MNRTQPSNPQSPATQLMVNFVLPTFVLLGLSDESRLGPAKAMLLALAFPAALELYALSQRRKPSMLSFIAIVGILVTGVIALMGLSENWLAIRRSLPYFVIALVLGVSMLLRRSLVDLALPYILNMDLIRSNAKKNGSWPLVQKRITTGGYAFIALLLAVGISSYILTLLVITAPTDTAAFNNEYVRLRVLSLVTSTLPLLIGFASTLLYVLNGVEKHTGLKVEDLIKKKK